ncbi:MAG: histidine kinase [Panacibacter sp.]
MRLPQYTKKDRLIFLCSMPAIVIILNSLLYGSSYFTGFKTFVAASMVTFIIMGSSWHLLTWINVELRNRFPSNHDLFKRLLISIGLSIIITWLTLTAIFHGYDYFDFFGYSLNETRYTWMTVIGVILNVFITFLHEGLDGFEKWKATLTETEQLKKEYTQSRLLGLKSQVNPHFLFNSLNSLSCLIHENQAKAETFLDEMSKVYRYLLRNSDEALVTLDAELQFAVSYFYLLKERYGEAIDLVINPVQEQEGKYLPPFTLQILLDSAFNQNMMSKEQPLHIEIGLTERGWLQIANNMQRKISGEAFDNTGISNISKKFRLLCNRSVIVKSRGAQQLVQVPLITREETSAA